jgi:hypothetical protein
MEEAYMLKEPGQSLQLFGAALYSHDQHGAGAGKAPIRGFLIRLHAGECCTGICRANPRSSFK